MLFVSNGESQHQGRRPFDKANSQGCERGILVFCLVLESQFSAFFYSLALFVPPFTNHVTTQPIGLWAYGRTKPNRAAHLVPLIAISVIRMELGIHRGISKAMKISLWSDLLEDTTLQRNGSNK